MPKKKKSGTHPGDFVESVADDLARTWFPSRAKEAAIGQFPLRAARRLADALVELHKQAPEAARATALALFAGVSPEELLSTDLEDLAPHVRHKPAPREWLRNQVDDLRERKAAKKAVPSRGASAAADHAFATLAQNPMTGEFVVTPVSQRNGGDMALVKDLRRLLRARPEAETALGDHLHGLSCLFSVESYYPPEQVQDSLDRLLGKLLGPKELPLADQFKIEGEGSVYVTLIDVKGLYEGLENVGALLPPSAPRLSRRSTQTIVNRIIERLSGGDTGDYEDTALGSVSESGRSMADELTELKNDDPDAVAGLALSLFFGLSLQQAATALDEPMAYARTSWDTVRTHIRDDLEYRRVFFASKKRHVHKPKAVATLARNPLSGALVSVPVGPHNKNDKKLASVIGTVLRQKATPRAALENRLRDFSCLIYISNSELPIRDSLKSLFADLATADIDSMPQDYFPAQLTIVKIGDIRRDMDRMGPRPKKDKRKLDTTKEMAPEDTLLPQAELSLKEIYELLGSAPVSDPTQVLVTVSRLIRALHEDLVAPAIQSCLDKIQVEVAARPESNFGSFEANKAFVDALREVLRRFDVRLECPTCHRPASLLLQQGTTKNGRFHFHHGAPDLRTNHGGKTSLPPLRLIPPDSTSTTD